MVKLNENKLNQILNRIKKGPQMKELYTSKFHKIVKFLQHNVGLNVSGVSPKGSIDKGTDWKKSDLDVIFRTNPNGKRKYMDYKHTRY